MNTKTLSPVNVDFDQMKQQSQALGMEADWKQFKKELMGTAPEATKHLSDDNNRSKKVMLASVASIAVGAVAGSIGMTLAAKKNNWSKTLKTSSTIGGGVAGGFVAGMIPGAILMINDARTGKKDTAFAPSQEIISQEISPKQKEAMDRIINDYQEKLNTRAKEMGQNTMVARYATPPTESKADAVKQSQAMAPTSHTV